MKRPHDFFSTPPMRWLPPLIACDGRLTEELRLERARCGLGHVPAQRLPQSITSMVCGYCSTGCSLNIHLRDGQAIGLTPNSDYPVNRGMACPKGWEALTVLDSAERATTPRLRGKAGTLEPVDWDTALNTFVERMRGIQLAHGRESVAFLSTGQLPTEEMALFGALAKFGMQMRHGDGNTRQCMATAVVAYKQAFGFDAPPYCYADLELSDLIVLIGSNLCIAHPILWQRVLSNRRNAQIVVIDPRMTETAMQATQHLPLHPKSDLVFMYGVARLLIERRWIDRDFIEAHTEGFEEFANHVRPYDLERVADETGLSPRAIEDFVEAIHRSQRVSFWWTMGVNQSHQGVRTAQAIINLALMTGNIGRPGTGANSITGQCNAMGSRLFSNTTNLLGGRDFADAADRHAVAEILGIDPRRIPSQPSWPYHRILEGILRKQIRGLWIVGTNPAHSWINQHQLRDVFERLDFLVVQDMYATTETAQMADLLLPAAAWGEKVGTVINSERRMGLIKKVAAAPGHALADFSIFRLVAEYWGCGSMFKKWSTPEAVFQLLKQLSADQPCDFSGVADYLQLDKAGGIQWPFPAGHVRPLGEEPGEVCSERRLFTDGHFYHADGKARFIYGDPRPCPEPPNDAFPFILLTGRGSAAQWHTQTRTRQSAVLRMLAPRDVYVEINPTDARRLGIRPGDSVALISQRGRLRAKAVVTPAVLNGQVFLPMHYAVTNVLTHAAFDPYSSQPAYKACAVRIERAS
jgi:anaerobic selenocysteine-containing dehydrogenase